MKNITEECLNDKIKLDKYQKTSIFCLMIVISGVFGWIYEFIFYYFNGGMKEFYMQGGNFLPWINIYAFGAIIIYLLTKNHKKSPLKVFVISLISTGVFEYISGLIIYKMFDGLRLWDYNVEILNFGNIGGFVCLRSVLFFGFSGLMLVYTIIPICIKIIKKCDSKKCFKLCLFICLVFLFDEVYNLIIARVLNTPRAADVYKNLGYKYVEFKK